MPSRTAGPPRGRLKGVEIRDTGPAASHGRWVIIDRHWRQGDRLEVTLPMRLRFSPAPDQPSVQAVTYGPVVLAGADGSSAVTAMPHLDMASITMATRRPLTFRARADNRPVTLVPVARAHHQHYTVYWNTAAPPARPLPLRPGTLPGKTLELDRAVPRSPRCRRVDTSRRIARRAQHRDQTAQRPAPHLYDRGWQRRKLTADCLPYPGEPRVIGHHARGAYAMNDHDTDSAGHRQRRYPATTPATEYESSRF